MRNGKLPVHKFYEGEMTIEKIIEDEQTNQRTVLFRPHQRSFDLFDVIVGSNTLLSGQFTIGPSDSNNDTIVESVYRLKS